MDDAASLALTFVTSAAIGLLVGLERERNPRAKAGLRTFALIAVLGSASALLAQATESGWVLGAALLAIGVAIAGAHLVDQDTRADDFGTTTVVAALLVFALGAINVFGYRLLAVAVGIGMTAMLHFKVELEGAAQRLTATDIRSILQFGAVSAVILPLLPNQPYGPYGVLNPFHIWLMVVLISGVSLAGYMAWRLTRTSKGLLLTGLLGGLVSSTATTLVYARQVRAATQSAANAQVVILLANGAMLMRVLVIIAIAAPGALWAGACTLLPAALLAVPIGLWRLRQGAVETRGIDEYRNPTNLLTAFIFAAFYASILLVSAWLSDQVGERGVYALAAISGLTDVDAITLSSLRLLATDALNLSAAMTTIGVAVGANLVLKSMIVFIVGGRAIGRDVAIAFLPSFAALAGGLAILHALA
jgi:uncharacterized membrane protein (DUF4010 family)